MRPAHSRYYARFPRLGSRYVRHNIPDGSTANFNIFEPSGYSAGTAVPLIMIVHGAGITTSNLLDSSCLRGPSDLGCLSNLTSNGYLAVSCMAGGTAGLADPSRTWGNPSSIDAYVDCYNYVAARYNVSRTLIWGASMGGLASLTLIGSGRIPNVRGCLLMYPVCSLSYMHASSSYTSEINTAWGGTWSSGLSAGYDPLTRSATDFARCPKYRILHSSADTVVNKTNNTDAFNTLASGSTTITVVSTTGDHGDASNWVSADVKTFMDSAT